MLKTADHGSPVGMSNPVWETKNNRLYNPYLISIYNTYKHIIVHKILKDSHHMEERERGLLCLKHKMS